MFVLASSVLRPNLKRVQMEKGRGVWKVKGNVSRAWDPRGWACGMSVVLVGCCAPSWDSGSLFSPVLLSRRSALRV